MRTRVLAVTMRRMESPAAVAISVTNVYVLGQRFDFVTFDPADTLPTLGTVDETGQAATLQDVANVRATTGLFGAGYLEMLARQMTADLQRIRDSIRHGETKELVAKGMPFGRLTQTKAGLWDMPQVEGLGRLQNQGQSRTATRVEADAIGRTWVGEGYTLASDGQTLVSLDRLRQYRPPSYKPRLG